MPISDITPSRSTTSFDRPPLDVQSLLVLQTNRKLTSETLLLLIYRKPRLNIDEVCDALGITRGTVYQRRARGSFGVPMFGSPLTADFRDVAAELDNLRAQARAGA